MRSFYKDYIGWRAIFSSSFFNEKLLSSFLRVLCIFCFCIFGFHQLQSQVTLTKIVDFASRQSGQNLTYTINFEYSDLINPCVPAVITDTLPTEVDFVSALPVTIDATNCGGSSSVSVNPSYDAVNHLVTWDFTAAAGGIPAGTSGTLTVIARIQEGTTPNSAVLTNDVTLLGMEDNATTTAIAAPDYTISKSVTTGNIYHDTDVTYRVRICSGGTTGNLNLSGVEVRDTLPPGAVFQSASPTETSFDAANGIVHWTVGSILVNDPCRNYFITVQYPSSDLVNNNTGLSTPIVKENKAVLEGTPVGEPVYSIDDSVDDSLLPPNFVVGLTKNAADNGILPVTDSSTFTFNLSNGSTVPVDDFTFTDDIPDQFDFREISLTGFSSSEDFDLRVDVNNSGSLTTIISSNTGSDRTYGHTDIVAAIPGFTSGTDYINQVVLEFNNVVSGFDGDLEIVVTSSNNYPNDNMGNPITLETPYTNTATVSATRPIDGMPVTPVSANDDMCVTDNTIARLDPQKSQSINYVTQPPGSNTSGNPYFVGSRVRYTVRIENDGTDGVQDNVTGVFSFADLTDPIASDLLPDEVTYVSGSWDIATNTTGLAFNNGGFNPAFEEIPNFNGSGRKLLRWSFTGDFEVGEYVEITFDVDINAGTVSQTATNNYCISASQDFICDEETCGETTNTDINNFFGTAVDPTTLITGITEMCCKSTSFLIVDSVAVIDLDKDILSSGPYAPTGTNSGTDTVEYRVTLGNDISANYTLDDPVAMDLLPEVLEFVPGSIFLESNTTGLSLAADGTNPIIEVIQDYNSTGRTLIRWSYNGAFPINTEVAFRFKTYIKSGASGSFANDFYAGTDERFYNCASGTSGVSDSNDLDGDGDIFEALCQTSSPNQSILTVASLGANKFVKGICDSTFLSLPDTALTFPGDSVIWRLIITNPGNVTLNNVSVYDIFPYIGDTGVRLNNQARETGWEPYLVESISVPTGITLYYSESQNPCRSPVNPVDGAAHASCVNDWNTTPPANLADVEAVRFDLNNPLAPLDSFQIDMKMLAPEGSFTIVNPTAWNSIARNADEVLPSEPNKVGVKLKLFDLALKKVVNSGDPAQYEIGQAANFDITLYNQGILNADSIRVLDYIPSGMSLNDGNWTAINDSLASRTLVAGDGIMPAGGLAPNDSLEISITLTIDQSPFPDSFYYNFAEIESAIEFGFGGIILPDVDSTPDSLQTNDNFVTDDDTSGDGKNGGDEDDQDRAPVRVRVCQILLSNIAVVDTLCHNNSTGSDVSDDYFLVTLNVAAQDPGPSNRYEVLYNAIILNPGGTDYGMDLQIGGNQEFAADGSSTFELTIRDLDDGANCQQTYTIGPLNNCFMCRPEICLPTGVQIIRN